MNKGYIHLVLCLENLAVIYNVLQKLSDCTQTVHGGNIRSCRNEIVFRSPPEKFE